MASGPVVAFLDLLGDRSELLIFHEVITGVVAVGLECFCSYLFSELGADFGVF